MERWLFYLLWPCREKNRVEIEYTGKMKLQLNRSGEEMVPLAFQMIISLAEDNITGHDGRKRGSEFGKEQELNAYI